MKREQLEQCHLHSIQHQHSGVSKSNQHHLKEKLYYNIIILILVHGECFVFPEQVVSLNLRE